MALPRGPIRKKPLDHVGDALMHLEEAQKALDRIDESKLSLAARRALARTRKSMAAGLTGCADSIEALLDGKQQMQGSAPPVVFRSDGSPGQ